MIDGLVDALFQNFMELMPFYIVHSYESSVRWTWGKKPRELGPGIHLRCYLMHSVQTVITVDDVIALPTQSVITKDEKLVCFKASFGYRVKDPVAHLCNVTDFIDSTREIAMQHLAKRVREKTLAEMVEDLNTLEKSLRGTLETKFKDWGTEITMVGFTDFAEVPTQVRLFQDGKSFI